MNPNHRIHRDRLIRAVQHYRDKLKPFRGTRLELIRDWCGPFYGAEDKTLGIIANFMKQTADAYAQSLAANCPRIFTETTYDELLGFAAHYAANMNALLFEIHFGETLREIANDAFVGLGICKLHLADSPYIEVEEDVWSAPGSPFASRISFDKWFHDTNTADFRKVQMAGDGYRVDFDSLRDSDVYDQKVVKRLKPTSKSGNALPEERAQDIATGVDTDDDEYRSMIDLMDIWLPRERQVITFACTPGMEGLDQDPLCVRDWDGADTGPYRLLNFGQVPDNIMPSSPAANIKRLNDITNSMLRKQNRGAKAQRDIPIYEPDSADDAKRLEKAEYGRWTMVKRKEGVGVLKLGGVDQANMVFNQSIQNLLDRMAGNLKAKAGLGSQADTATQEGMIAGEVAQAEGFMVNRMMEFVEFCVRDLGDLLWDHPTKIINTSIEVPGLRKRVPSNWNALEGMEPGFRLGERYDYNLRINPYSLAYRSASQRASELRSLCGELAQLLPMMQQAGANAAEYVSMIAELYDQPALRRIFPADQTPGRYPPPMDEAPKAGTFGKPNGNYTRKSVGSGVDQSNTNAMLPAMMSGMGQQAGGMMVGAQ